MGKDYVKIYDEIWEGPAAKRPNYLAVLLYLYSHANRRSKRMELNGEHHVIERGQCFASITGIAEFYNMAKSTVKYIIDYMVSKGLIEHYASPNCSIFTIKNYDNLLGHDEELNTKYAGSCKEIFEFWNEKKIIIHKKLDEGLKGSINAKLEVYECLEIKQAIHNYNAILKCDDYWFNYYWSLKDFLQRGFDKFKDSEVAHNNYVKKEGIIGRTRTS